MGMPAQNMGLYMVLSVIGTILRLAKEIFIVILLFQFIRISAMYIKKHKNNGDSLDKSEVPKEYVLAAKEAIETDNTEDDTNNIQE